MTSKTITVGELIQVLNEIEDKNMPVYIVEQAKRLSKNAKGDPVYKVKNEYEITTGGLIPTGFALAFHKDSKVQ